MRAMKRPAQSGLLSTWGGTPKRAPAIGVQVMFFMAKRNKIIYIVKFRGSFGHRDSNLCTATILQNALTSFQGVFSLNNAREAQLDSDQF